ncbi:MAG: hypothetical protein QOC72_3833 [Methylobacteriaceae bacterium]|nr:hypothetical protein [Methylobacteriaceae bacterium]
MRPELSPRHPVQPGIQQGRARLATLSSHVDAEPNHHHPVARDQDRNGLGWRDVRVELEIDAGASIEIARYLRPLSYGSKAIAHIAEMETREET